MQPQYNTLFVTLDIGKNVHWVGAYEGFKLKACPLTIRITHNFFGVSPEASLSRPRIRKMVCSRGVATGKPPDHHQSQDARLHC